MKSATEWIKELELEPHPEGGWFRRVYESGLHLVNDRPVMTSIYYLLEGTDFSAFHRLRSDEQWHFYAGFPITVYEITPAETVVETTLGNGRFQHTVQAGNLFAATVQGAYALVGCTVVPGFDFADFEMPERTDLLKCFPQHEGLIQRLSR